MARPRWVLPAAVACLGLIAGGCQEDSPEQDVPPGIFTTTLGSQTPDTSPSDATTATTGAPTGAPGY